MEHSYKTLNSKVWQEFLTFIKEEYQQPNIKLAYFCFDKENKLMVCVVHQSRVVESDYILKAYSVQEFFGFVNIKEIGITKFNYINDSKSIYIEYSGAYIFGHHIGKNMRKGVEHFASMLGCSHISLCSKIKAIGYWEKQGFEIDHIQTNNASIFGPSRVEQKNTQNSEGQNQKVKVVQKEMPIMHKRVQDCNVFDNITNEKGFKNLSKVNQVYLMAVTKKLQEKSMAPMKKNVKEKPHDFDRGRDR